MTVHKLGTTLKDDEFASLLSTFTALHMIIIIVALLILHARDGYPTLNM